MMWYQMNKRRISNFVTWLPQINWYPTLSQPSKSTNKYGKNAYMTQIWYDPLILVCVLCVPKKLLEFYFSYFEKRVLNLKSNTWHLRYFSKTSVPFVLHERFWCILLWIWTLRSKVRYKLFFKGLSEKAWDSRSWMIFELSFKGCRCSK